MQEIKEQKNVATHRNLNIFQSTRRVSHCTKETIKYPMNIRQHDIAKTDAIYLIMIICSSPTA